MESCSKLQENRNQYLPSPRSYSSSGSSSSSNGVVHQGPTTPKSAIRSDINQYPTTFVQADPSSFKQVVQILTGSSDTAKSVAKQPSTADPPPSSAKSPIPPIRSGPKKPQSGFKLYERRSSLTGLNICPVIPGIGRSSGFSPRNAPEVLSPSMLDFPSLVLSPVTPLIPDPFNGPPPPQKMDLGLDPEVSAEKGFYFHPSPATTPRDVEPRLLPLFPMTSTKESDSPSS